MSALPAAPAFFAFAYFSGSVIIVRAEDFSVEQGRMLGGRSPVAEFHAGMSRAGWVQELFKRGYAPNGTTTWAKGGYPSSAYLPVVKP